MRRLGPRQRAVAGPASQSAMRGRVAVAAWRAPRARPRVPPRGDGLCRRPPDGAAPELRDGGGVLTRR